MNKLKDGVNWTRNGAFVRILPNACNHFFYLFREQGGKHDKNYMEEIMVKKVV